MTKKATATVTEGAEIQALRQRVPRPEDKLNLPAQLDMNMISNSVPLTSVFMTNIDELVFKSQSIELSFLCHTTSLSNKPALNSVP